MSKAFTCTFDSLARLRIAPCYGKPGDQEAARLTIWENGRVCAVVLMPDDLRALSAELERLANEADKASAEPQAIA